MKKLIAVLLSVALCVSLSACGKEPDQSGTATGPAVESTTVPTEAAQQIDAEVFKGGIRSSAKSMSFFSEIYIVVLEYQSSYWETTERMLLDKSPEDIAKKGIEALEDAGISFDDIKEVHETYSETYKAVVLTDVYSNELREIKNAYIAYFDAYLDMYNLMTSPTGDCASFASSVSECVKTYKNALAKIDIFLGITTEITPEETKTIKATESDLSTTYVLDTKSKTFHYVHCKTLADIPMDDQKTVSEHRENLIADGYSACGKCRS